MTDKEFVTALQCCANTECGSCPASPDRNEIYPFCDKALLREAAIRFGQMQRVVRCKACWMFDRCLIAPMLGENGYCAAGEAMNSNG